jgi:hypothetical protein
MKSGILRGGYSSHSVEQLRPHDEESEGKSGRRSRSSEMGPVLPRETTEYRWIQRLRSVVTSPSIVERTTKSSGQRVA